MIVLLDTSSSTCKLTLINGEDRRDYNWEAGRELSTHLHKLIVDKLSSFNKSINDIKAICVFRGPGSFTGLRIGISVANSLADSLNVPIVGASGENWVQDCLYKINEGVNEKLVTPLYGSEARISQPKK